MIDGIEMVNWHLLDNCLSYALRCLASDCQTLQKQVPHKWEAASSKWLDVNGGVTDNWEKYCHMLGMHYAQYWVF